MKSISLQDRWNEDDIEPSAITVEKRNSKQNKLFHSGGPGSGHFGHKGREGEVGGSAPRNLTGREQHTVNHYKNTGYAHINRSLREGKYNELSPSSKESIAALDNLIEENQLQEDMVVYRVVSGKRNGDKYFKEGVVTDKAFLSTSTSEYSAIRAVEDAEGGRIKNMTTLEIRLPKGSHAFDLQSSITVNPIGSMSQGNEQELLLPRDLPLRVVSYDEDNRRVILEPTR